MSTNSYSNSYQKAIHRLYSRAVISIGYLLAYCSDPSEREALISARRVIYNIGERLSNNFSD